MSNKDLFIRSMKVAAVMAFVLVVGCALYRGSVHEEIWGTDR